MKRIKKIIYRRLTVLRVTENSVSNTLVKENLLYVENCESFDLENVPPLPVFCS